MIAMCKVQLINIKRATDMLMLALKEIITDSVR